MNELKVFAYYLPQFYPTKENDDWWGPGFTEWTNVALAQKQFKGHYQPKVPGELGFYDLRLNETVIAQAKLAKDHNISAFCYWHYWLGGGKRMLDLPAENLINSIETDFPFFFAWANHDWKGVFFGAQNKILLTQKYGGKEEISLHFDYLIDFFNDTRYYKIDKKPVLQIYNPRGIPNCKEYLEYYNYLAVKSGFEGLYFIGENIEEHEKHIFGLDAVTYSRHRAIEYKGHKNKYLRKTYNFMNRAFPAQKIYEYKDAMKFFLKDNPSKLYEYPSIIPNWDTTARLKDKATILKNSSPDLFRQHINEVFSSIIHKPKKHQIVYLKSWNEWAEGNYIEPDRKWGRKYLEVLRDEINNFNQNLK